MSAETISPSVHRLRAHVHQLRSIRFVVGSRGGDQRVERRARRSLVPFGAHARQRRDLLAAPPPGRSPASRPARRARRRTRSRRPSSGRPTRTDAAPRKADSAIACWNQPASIPVSTPSSMEPVPHRVDLGEDRLGLLLHAVGHRLDEVRARRADRSRRARRSRTRSPAVSGARASRCPPSGARAPRRARSCAATASRRAPPASASIVVRTTLFIGCCAVSDTPAVCVWNRSFIALGSVAPYRSLSQRAQIRRAARSFAISSKKSMCALKKNDRPGANVFDVEPARLPQLDVGEPVGQRERELLRRRRSGLADVIAGDAHRMPSRHVLGAERHQVADQPQVRARREDPLLLRDVLLHDVGLQRAVQLAPTARPAARRSPGRTRTPRPPDR